MRSAALGAAWSGIAALAAVLPACAATNAESKPVGDGSHHIKCETPLTACLKEAEQLCPGVSYDVLAARDRRTYTGAAPAEVEHRASEAVIVCGSRGAPLFDEPDLVEQVQASKGGAEQPAGPAAPAAPQPALACTPGVSQACVGVGGCEGGQACLADGSGFGPCQCAPASEPDNGSEAAPEAPNPETGSSAGDTGAGEPKTDSKAPAGEAPTAPAAK